MFFRMATRTLLIPLAIIVALVGCTSKPEQAKDSNSSSVKAAGLSDSPFVSVKGRHFYLRAKPYYVVGANFWYGAYLGASGDLGNRARLRKELDLLKATGINNLRVLAISEQSDLVRAVRPAIINQQGEFNQDILQGLDYLLAEMAKRDMKAVLYLNNFWQWSGGMSQYVSWLTGKPVLDPDVTGQWNDFMQNSAEFYRLDAAQQLYHKVIKTLVTRTNSITGIAYNQDPTIMSWQLANEPRPGSDADGRANAQVFYQWIKTSAHYIHQLAPQQLVSTGNEGIMGSLGDKDIYIAAHNTAEIDYLTFHMWAKNWGWFDAQKAEQTYPLALEKARAYINAHIDIANQLNKPVVMEEFGLERDGGSFSPASSTHYRDQYYQAVFTQLVTRAQAGDAIGGYNIWAWGGYGRSQRADHIWQQGDDFMGDPPQEPQGLNSVFDTDASTRATIQSSAKQFDLLMR